MENHTTTVLVAARIVGALAIAGSGLAHFLGQPEIANLLMLLGAGAASPK